MRYLLAAALVCAVAQFEPAFAAGPFDGDWHGAVAGNSAQCPANVFDMSIHDNLVHGKVLGRVPFKGTVTADGTVTAAYDLPNYSMSGKITGTITGGQFTGRLESVYEAKYACARDLSAKHD